MTLETDYAALTDSCGFVELQRWSVISLSGEDRHTFLQNMCTNDIKQLSPGQGCEAFCTDVKGKIHAHVFVLLGEEKTTLLTFPDQAAGIIASLDRYIIREDVQLADETESSQLLFVSGSGAAESLKRPAPIELDSLNEPWQHARFELERGRGAMVRFPLSGRDAFLLLIEAGAEGLMEKLKQAGATQCSSEAWNVLRIESGLPLFGIDFHGEHLPQEIARDSLAISFTKGCYLGQETVARLDALGHVNKQLVTVKYPDDAQPAPGIPLTYQQKQVGEATSVAVSPAVGAPIGIAMIRREANAVGTVLDSPVGPVEVIATPAVG